MEREAPWTIAFPKWADIVSQHVFISRLPLSAVLGP